MLLCVSDALQTAFGLYKAYLFHSSSVKGVILTKEGLFSRTFSVAWCQCGNDAQTVDVAGAPGNVYPVNTHTGYSTYLVSEVNKHDGRVCIAYLSCVRVTEGSYVTTLSVSLHILSPCVTTGHCKSPVTGNEWSLAMNGHWVSAFLLTQLSFLDSAFFMKAPTSQPLLFHLPRSANFILRR